MGLKYKIFLAAAVALTSGCSTLFSESSYSVTVDSEPKGAEFTVTNREGFQIHSGVTPAALYLDASSGYFSPENYVIEISKNGYQSQVHNLKSGVDPWYFGNILIGGLIGMVGVDPATGAMYKLPDAIRVPLTPVQSTIAAGKPDVKAGIEATQEIQPALAHETANPGLHAVPVTANGEVNVTPEQALAMLNQPTNYSGFERQLLTTHEQSSAELDGISRICFEGVYYDIESGAVVGERRFGNGAREKSQILWSGQKNPQQFNELVEQQLEAKGYPLSKYENRLLKIDRADADDLNVGMIVEEIDVEYRDSSHYRKKMHRVKLQAKFKAYQKSQAKVVYEKSFVAEAADMPSSRVDTINAFPEAIKILVSQLLEDPAFAEISKPQSFAVGSQ